MRRPVFCLQTMEACLEEGQNVLLESPTYSGTLAVVSTLFAISYFLYLIYIVSVCSSLYIHCHSSGGKSSDFNLMVEGSHLAKSCNASFQTHTILQQVTRGLCYVHTLFLNNRYLCRGKGRNTLKPHLQSTTYTLLLQYCKYCCRVHLKSHVPGYLWCGYTTCPSHRILKGQASNSCCK